MAKQERFPILADLLVDNPYITMNKLIKFPLLYLQVQTASLVVSWYMRVPFLILANVQCLYHGLPVDFCIKVIQESFIVLQYVSNSQSKQKSFQLLYALLFIYRAINTTRNKCVFVCNYSQVLYMWHSSFYQCIRVHDW